MKAIDGYIAVLEEDGLPVPGAADKSRRLGKTCPGFVLRLSPKGTVIYAVPLS